MPVRRHLNCMLLLAMLAVPGSSRHLEAQGLDANRVRTLSDTLPGAVGGVTVDRAGMIYVADFRETVWKITPDGRASVFATGLYGASGNAIDSRGNLLQSNFFGNYISRIDRHGNEEPFADGFQGPVGIAAAPGDTLYVCNCSGNSISKVGPDGAVENFVASGLLNCPNGIARGPNGNFYVVNFSDEKMLKITPDGVLSEFAVLPGGGNGHVTVARGQLYATSLQGQRVYRVTLQGEVTLIAGTGNIGELDGPGSQATFSWPNGIAAGALGDRLYINDFINRFPPAIEVPPQPLFTVRQIKLASMSDVVAAAFQAGGIEAMVTAYRSWKSDPATRSLFTETEINRLGYQLMGQGSLDAAIELFKLNVESYPRSANVYDSLAEAYANSGDTKRAIEFYQRSLDINPGNQNAVEQLRRLRGGS